MTLDEIKAIAEQAYQKMLRFNESAEKLVFADKDAPAELKSKSYKAIWDYKRQTDFTNAYIEDICREKGYKPFKVICSIFGLMLTKCTLEGASDYDA